MKYLGSPVLRFFHFKAVLRSLAIAIFVSSCTSTVPAFVAILPAVPLEGPPRVLLLAPSQGHRIAESLRRVGIEPVVKRHGNEYELVVEVGSDRSRPSCGTVNNVRYSLRRGSSIDILIIQGRGMTGNCSPNIFDDMSATLALYFSDS